MQRLARALSVIKRKDSDLFIAVLFVVSFHRLFSVPSGVNCVGSGRVGVMRRLFMLSRLVMLGRFAMMASRMGMMF
jgi:hypothetical protein